MSVPAQIPLPEGFSIAWENPEDQSLFWTRDRMHSPDPVTMVGYEISRNLNEVGMVHGFTTYHVPLRSTARRYWTYQYGATSMLPLSEAEMAEVARRSEQALMETMGQLEHLWNTSWLPRVQEHIEFWTSFPLGDASMRELAQHFEDTLARMEAVWKIHFEIAFPMMLAMSLFDELYHDLFQPESQLAAYRLLQGFDNMTLKGNRELWRLSRKALAIPMVSDILTNHAPVDVIPALRALPEAESFLNDLDAYLAEYGHRGDNWSIAEPTWFEDPTTVIWNLQDYIAQPDRTPDLEVAALVAERDQLIAEARDRLAGYPEAVRNQFEFLLTAAQAGIVLTEEHGWWIDFRAVACARNVFMEHGRRFTAAGVVDDPQDIFHLTLAEIRETAAQLPNLARQEIIKQRKDEIAHYGALQPPLAIGTPPPGPPPDSPLMRMMGKFFGTPPEPSDDLNLLRGAAGSAGVVQGTARVVKSLAEASRVQQGDILVATTTAPPWTPLFATVAAVVTDTGGILSHCAVVAREYGIPAVVGTGVATSRIVDGQTIEVDGNLGTVRIIDNDVEPVSAPVHAGAGPVPVPENFPVVWEHPDDERGFWVAERMHWPNPLPPLDFETMRDAHQGFTGAFATYGVPLQYNVRLINYYWYFAVGPSIADHSEMPARMQQGSLNVENTVPRLQQLWTEEWLPEVEEHLAYWRTFDLQGATMGDLLTHLDESETRHKRVWHIHFLQTFPVYMAMSQFDDLYQDLFGNENALDAYRLMQGFENKTVEIGREMWRLSRKALAAEEVRSCFEENEAAEILPALSQTEAGRAFLDDLHAFLQEYGRRGEKIGISFPSWLEEPQAAIRNIQEFVSQPDLDFDLETARLAEARELAVAEAREALKNYPRQVVEQFEAALTYAQQATVISEDHTVFIDFGEIYELRQVIMEFGRRLRAARVIDSVEDVFLLTMDELRETCDGLPSIPRQELVARRKAEIEHFSTITPPPVLGTPSPPPPQEDPLSRTVGKFFGAPPVAPEMIEESLVLKGGSGSSGRASGIARVITSLADAGRLQKGEILVAPTTAPAWTPLFATAAAVVTDTGGILSHCAVVAREYGIPAVVGTGMATSLIVDGQIIEVDGDLGTVKIIR